MENIYLDFNKILSYSSLLKIIIAERGVGKSFGAKDYTIKHYRKTKKKFIWIRRNITDLNEAVGSKKNPLFYKPLQNKYPNFKFSIDENKNGKIIKVNNVIYGYGIGLRQAESIKGSEYDDVDTIIFDEFLVGDGGSHYLRNEPMYLLSIIETVGRLRPINIILLGNATSVANPYFDFFNIGLPYNSEFKTFKNNQIVIWYAKNEGYRNKKKQTPFGQLVENTPYEKYAIENQFINDSNNFIKKKTPQAKLFTNLILNNKNLGIWLDKENIYISKKYNSTYNLTLSLSSYDHNEKTILIKKSNVFIKNIINHYQTGNLFFENQNIKHEFIDAMRKNHFIY